MNSFIKNIVLWFDTGSPEQQVVETAADSAVTKKIDWVRCAPFVAFHLACLSVIWVGWSPAAVWTAVAFYFIRMFAITGVYHRYFAHKTYHTSRVFQFLLAVLGASSVQRGPLWWAAHHRKHHLYSDTELDVHSPRIHGFWWAHMGWIMSKKNFPTDYKIIPDFTKYPELVFLNRFDVIVPVLTGLAVFGWGKFLEAFAPGLGTNGAQMLVWGFFISTTFLFHGTFTINSLSHVFGSVRFQTGDDSKNNFWLALITMGEGWHNNHHHYQVATRQGFYWWELDATYYVLKALSAVGLVWDLRPVPARVLDPALRNHKAGRLPGGNPKDEVPA
jgi:stearoyl-CoA desaturase (delta-9 desaturase)